MSIVTFGFMGFRDFDGANKSPIGRLAAPVRWLGRANRRWRLGRGDLPMVDLLAAAERRR
jgi:hypothetical protein